MEKPIQFFLPMEPPTVTHQEKKINIRGSKPIVYEGTELKAARGKLRAYLGQHRPEEPLEGAVQLIVKWLFPAKGKHKNGEWKITKPDTDNLNKLLKDCMTAEGFWKDDAQVCSEIIEKFWAEVPGIWVCARAVYDG